MRGNLISMRDAGHINCYQAHTIAFYPRSM